MSFKHHVSLGLVGLALAVVGASGTGCGSSSSPKGTGAASTSTGSSPTGSSSSGVGHSASSTGVGGAGTGGTGGAGTGGGANNHDPADAVALTLNTVTVSALKDVSTPDFYTFTTTKPGDRLLIEVDPTDLPANQITDASVFSPAIAVFDSAANAMSGMQLTYAMGGDPYSGQITNLYIEVATPGTYYILLEDCTAFFSSGCPNPASGVTLFDYKILVAETSALATNKAFTETTANTSQNGTTANAQTITYAVPNMGTAGDYGENLIDGDLASATATHVYSFTPPTAVTTMAGATPRADFFVMPIGGSGMTDEFGDLSDANIKIWVTKSDGTTILASADQSNFPGNDPLTLSLPVTLGTQYYLFVQNTQTAGSPTKDFYIVQQYFNSDYDFAELEGATSCGSNDTPGTAETLPAQNKTLFTVDGHIAQAGAMCTSAPDVDYYKFAVPASTTSYLVECQAARNGSGLTGFNVQLYKADGTTTIGSLYTESATMDLADTNFNPLPSGVAAGDFVYLKAAANGQDATDTGTYYRCFVFFQ